MNFIDKIGKFIVSQNFLVCANEVVHSDIYKKHGHLMFNDDGIGEKPIGGGFIKVDNEIAVIDEESETYGKVPLETLIEIQEDLMTAKNGHIRLKVGEPYLKSINAIKRRF